MIALYLILAAMCAACAGANFANDRPGVAALCFAGALGWFAMFLRVV